MDEELVLNSSPVVKLDEETLERARNTRYPSPINNVQNLTNEEKIARIEDSFRDIMITLGLDLEDDSLKRTPHRVAKMYVEEVFSGLNPSTFPQVSLFDDKFQHDDRSNMVFVKLNFCSFCEHHFVPMAGTACIAYIPNGKLIGFSKIPRIVRYFARRPQVQERLTAQIADALSILTGTEHVAVSICAQHHCMIARGVESDNSHAITNVLRGDFNSSAPLRKEFFDALDREVLKK